MRAVALLLVGILGLVAGCPVAAGPITPEGEAAASHGSSGFLSEDTTDDPQRSPLEAVENPIRPLGDEEEDPGSP